MSGLFSDRHILITGACGGIGRATVLKLAEQGATLALADVEIEAVEQLADQLRASGHRVFAFGGDLTDRDYCDQLPARAFTVMGALDGLNNNAGLMRRGSITNVSDEDFNLSMAVNVEAPFRLCRAAIPLMAQSGGGTIVNTASCWGKYPGPNHLVYCVSKGALTTMTQCLGRDHAQQNIRVNAVCPNEVNTPMLRSGFEIRGFDSDQAIAELNASVPLGRIAEPEEIADVILFLSSPQSSYMCGALVEVNGGKPVY